MHVQDLHPDTATILITPSPDGSYRLNASQKGLSFLVTPDGILQLSQAVPMLSLPGLIDDLLHLDDPDASANEGGTVYIQAVHADKIACICDICTWGIVLAALQKHPWQLGKGETQIFHFTPGGPVNTIWSEAANDVVLGGAFRSPGFAAKLTGTGKVVELNVSSPSTSAWNTG